MATTTVLMMSNHYPHSYLACARVAGQDGSYLAEFLLQKGYVVYGLMRRSSSFNTGRIEHIYKDKHQSAVRLFLEYGDLTDSGNLCELVARIRPDEIYNLAAQSHVKVSFELSEYTANVDGLGTLRLLNAIRICGLEKKCRFYQASTSELYGKVQEIPQRETTPFYPRSPYAVAKQYAYWQVINYREAYGMFASNGILFNHESPRRGPTFVTRKITRAVARITRGLQHTLFLGNLDSKRDWGHARDYVEGMWLMMQQVRRGEGRGGRRVATAGRVRGSKRVRRMECGLHPQFMLPAPCTYPPLPSGRGRRLRAGHQRDAHGARVRGEVVRRGGHQGGLGGRGRE